MSEEAISHTAIKVKAVEHLFKKPSVEERNAKSLDCSKVYVAPSPLGGHGAFAAVDIKAGDLVEYGLARRLPLDGNVSPFVFTWSEDRTIWATCGGCAIFYNTHPTTPNTEMFRYFEEDRFEIFAIEDIPKGTELLHTYRSLKWRKCFIEEMPEK